jgi:hypothetical protein
VIELALRLTLPEPQVFMYKLLTYQSIMMPNAIIMVIIGLGLRWGLELRPNPQLNDFKGKNDNYNKYDDLVTLTPTPTIEP